MFLFPFADLASEVFGLHWGITGMQSTGQNNLLSSSLTLSDVMVTVKKKVSDCKQMTQFL